MKYEFVVKIKLFLMKRTQSLITLETLQNQPSECSGAIHLDFKA